MRRVNKNNKYKRMKILIMKKINNSNSKYQDLIQKLKHIEIKN